MPTNSKEPLSSHLWEAANILRGPVDAADFKTYIFPLLFFKRLSDVYDEEVAVALEESDGDVEFAQFPENHRFQVPEGCHWQDVRAKSANIGHAPQKAMRCIEQVNPDTLHGIFGDAQRTNFVEGDRLVRFDVVLAHPPYSIKQWDRDAWAADPWDRNLYGTPPQGRADYAFWPHIIQSMKAESGRCALLFPDGVLFRNEERAMREKLVAHDVVECVLGLGPNLFYNSPMEACVVICRMNKPRERRNRVLFINAANEVTRERAQSFLADDHLQRIVAAYQAFDDQEGFARVVGNAEIREKGGTLNIPLYVRAQPTAAGKVAEEQTSYGKADLKQAITNWQESSTALRESMNGLFEVLEDARGMGGAK